MSDAPRHPVSFTIPRDKLTHYLLDLSHPRGGAKAKFFLAFGFHADRPMELADALASHVLEVLPWRLPTTGGLGGKLIYEGPIAAPDGSHPWVRSIWQVEADGTARLISAVPLRQRS